MGGLWVVTEMSPGDRIQRGQEHVISAIFQKYMFLTEQFTAIVFLGSHLRHSAVR